MLKKKLEKTDIVGNKTKWNGNMKNDRLGDGKSSPCNGKTALYGLLSTCSHAFYYVIATVQSHQNVSLLSYC